MKLLFLGLPLSLFAGLFVGCNCNLDGDCYPAELVDIKFTPLDANGKSLVDSLSLSADLNWTFSAPSGGSIGIDTFNNVVLLSMSAGEEATFTYNGAKAVFQVSNKQIGETECCPIMSIDRVWINDEIVCDLAGSCDRVFPVVLK